MFKILGFMMAFVGGWFLGSGAILVGSLIVVASIPFITKGAYDEIKRKYLP